MSHSFAQILIHLVFSTKDRQPTIPDSLEEELYKVIVGIGRSNKIEVLRVGGMPNHVHLLFALPRLVPLPEAVQKIKANSSRWVRERTGKFEWQEGYGAFSVSASNREAVIRYIDEQKQHHAKLTYEDEFVALLRKHEMEFDPRFGFG
jgi:putative transposase